LKQRAGCLSSLQIHFLHPSYKIYRLGEYALSIEFGNVIEDVVNGYVLSSFLHIEKLHAEAITDLIPCYSSLTVVYDGIKLKEESSPFHFMVKKITAALTDVDWNGALPSKLIEIPACYDESFGTDLKQIAAEKNLSVTGVISLHASKTYRVYMIGFLPGFPYMGSVDERIAMPRKVKPDLTIKAGSIGIAGKQTGIYPANSPGGWNIIGRTPLTMFNVKSENAALLKAGDRVKFIPISLKDFSSLNQYHGPEDS
jgi:inhibitor of KinA